MEEKARITTRKARWNNARLTRIDSSMHRRLKWLAHDKNLPMVTVLNEIVAYHLEGKTNGRLKRRYYNDAKIIAKYNKTGKWQKTKITQSKKGNMR